MSVLALLSEPHDADLAELNAAGAIDLMAFCRCVLRGELGSALTLSPAGDIDFASRPVLAHLGRDAASLAGVSWASLWPQAERGKIAEAIAAASSGQIARFQAFSPTPDGAPRWWDVVVYPFSIDAGQLPQGRRMLAVFRNITALREGQDKLAQSMRLEALGQLTGGVAHDFNNLLTVILGATETLAAELPAGSHHRDLAEVTLQAAERGADLVRRLLTFCRHQSLEPQNIDCGGMLGSVHSLAQHLVRDDIRLTVSAPEVPLYCRADRAELEAALLNLCINARDAMPGGGRLSLDAEAATLGGKAARQLGLAPGSFVIFTVKDAGVGMTAETLRRAIEPFFTTKGPAGGSGLGLSTVYGFAQQSGGGLTIASKPRRGTTVRLYLPRAAGAAQGQLDLPTASVEPTAAHVLLVEDDALVRAQAARLLAGLGHRVTLAEDGPSALTALRAAPDIALLMTDVVMPGGMTGRELAGRATAEHDSLQVLLTSGYSEDLTLAGAGPAFLAKPYRRAQLAAAVSEALSRSESLAGGASRNVIPIASARRALPVRQAL
ncbi:MAG: hybrid sensor histidine kinase/response regulator [Phenylobacterium sp.]|nr:hybrid sensor histidine kinase/response regulator [Phenylobacterium sp.]